MSILPRRRLLSILIAVSLLLPLISFSQVTIKEKVEIKPRVKLPSNASVALTITFHWTAKLSDLGNHLMHLRVIDPGSHDNGFNPNTGSTSGNYTERVTEVTETNYSGECTYTNSSPLSGYYYLYAIHDVETWWINYEGYYYIDLKAPGIIDTTIYLENPGWTRMYELPYVVNGITCTFWGPPPEPCGGVNIHIGDITDVQHGEQKYIGISVVDNCGLALSDLPEHFYKYELLGDAATWGLLRDPITGRTGAILDSVNSLSIEFDAWGKDTDSVRVLSIRVSAENGSMAPVTAAFTLLPPEVRVLAGKTTLAFGDTTLLTMQVRYPNSAWMERPYDWRSWFAIAQGDTFGHLYTPDSSDYGEAIYGYNPGVIYYAHPQVAVDSDEVLIVLSASEPSSGDTGIRVPVYRDKSSMAQRLGKKVPQPNSTTGATKKKGDAISVRDNPSSHYGLVRLKLRRSQILLGETKYYYARKDESGNLIIEETTNPDIGTGLATVIMEDPVIAGDAVNNDKIGVYWDYFRPDGSSLDNGVIRLIGRYWKQDTTYKVRLRAVLQSDGSSASVEIMVKKPDVLGDKNLSPAARHSIVKDVFNNDVNLDSLILRYAGANGIPPQLIKGQMEKECMNPHTMVFEPVWRYEPMKDLEYQQKEKWSERFFPNASPFVKSSDYPRGTGDWPYDAQPRHSNVFDTAYNSTAVTIGSYLAENWDKYKKKGALGKPDTILRGIDLSRRLEELYKPPTKLNGISDRQAKQSAYATLGKELNDAETKLAQKYDLMAQTRIVTSYGFAQVMYSMAIDDDGKYFKETDGRYFPTGTPYMEKLNSHRYPEMLNEQNTFMPIYCDRLLRNLNKLFPLPVPASQWFTTKVGQRRGYEANWQASLRYYNGKPEYAGDVMLRSTKYSPH